MDLSTCDREPIHIPGLIQPHGALLVLQEPGLIIVQVSGNTLEILGHRPKELLRQPLSILLAPQQIAAIQQCLSEDTENVNPLDIAISYRGSLLMFDGNIHRQDALVLLELEPQDQKQRNDYSELHQGVKSTITKIQKSSSLLKMCELVVKEVKKITGFDRIMVYQFDADGAGEVIAEERTEGLTPYLGLRYPASDIPVQAKQLYTLNWLRLIPDSSYTPVALVPERNPVDEEPTDLSFALLRSVSPLHLEYLNNMGVAASMSISLIQDQKLWGLIACHHSRPRHVPSNLRIMCEFIGQVMSLDLSKRVDNQDLSYKLSMKSLQSKLVESLSQSKQIIKGSIQLDESLLELVSATGAIFCTADHSIGVGQTPPASEWPALRDWIKTQMQDNMFQSRSLSRLYPAATSFKAVASGVLALEISQFHQDFVIWFRPEVIETVTWAGNPHKPVEVASNGIVTLSPRKSFQQWKETLQGCALPWKPCELKVVAELRSLIVSKILKQAADLANVNLELERSNIELDSFAYVASHDLKEPLRGIHNYSNFLIEDYAEVLDTAGVDKLATLVRLTQRMEDLINSLLHYSQLGRIELSRQPTDLAELVEQTIEVLRISQPQSSIDFRMSGSMPMVDCDRTQISEVLTNLLTNAIKYNDKAEKWVEIGCAQSGNGDSDGLSGCTFFVRDNGIGIPPQHLERVFQIFKRLHTQDQYGGGTGAGLTIVRKIVHQHGGKIWVESSFGEGSTFFFTLASGEQS
ncbi:GAF domain-containing protein [Synechococcus sp. CS-602]|uniref:ATP-binding protein n=1 Tax=Synechococcaceae TaxID=1890426 RepID=UPI0008FF10DA|nr:MULTISPECIES: ATP-binding protein [Synechococcaceae]MCT4364659.1 ATP-binding protein [Candidatus Regnicoccus frigidus MAG-AL1]APD47762.1 cyanobacterial phytochrome A [Synechococcus sp. SynAce01]MCT0202826.1 GAF domain-containing protein [Synechococcus sp. CS-603]MCT0204816.1 GAF domain-containing protein [Synechococcus sp. CS-602]MCT0245052.1 GAF domain-containing protein [Synechococcus sp. CS-601]